MNKINADGISIKDMQITYNVIWNIMEKNDFNFNTAWEHVRSALARAIVENAKVIE